jgi:hypothetical protein
MERPLVSLEAFLLSLASLFDIGVLTLAWRNRDMIGNIKEERCENRVHLL